MKDLAIELEEQILDVLKGLTANEQRFILELCMDQIPDEE